MIKQIRLLLFIFALLIAAVSGWRMWSLFQDDTLWGALPLVFFLSAWVCLMVPLTRKKQEPKSLRLLFLSSLSGMMLAFSFPSVLPEFLSSLSTVLLFGAMVPLLMIEKALENEKRAGRKLMFYAYNSFVLWNVLATWWVGNTAFAAGIVAIWLNSFFMTVPIWLFHKTKKFVPKVGYAAFPAYWITFELLHLNWEISWSWLNLGNAFAEHPTWIQWYEYTGTFGGTLWVLLANLLIFKTFFDSKKSENEIGFTFKKLLYPAALILLPIGISLFMYQNQEQKGVPIETVVIQPNFEPHYEKFSIADGRQMRRFIALADSAITPKTKYLVFPETSFGLVEINDFTKNREITTLQEFLEKHPQITLITGIDAYRVFDTDEPPTPNMRTLDRKKGIMRYEMYNAAIQMRAGEEEFPVYKKSKFVPGAEIFPYSKVLFFFEPLVNYLGGSVKGLGGQKQRTPFESNSVKIAPSICYESVFGAYNNGYVKLGAEATFIMTNDGWWDDSPGHRQHLKFARLRSIETRRDIARSANTGVSCFINQRGDILQPTKYDEPIAIRGDVYLNKEITFYVIWGDMIARLGLFTTLLLLANLFVKSRMNVKKSA